ncbi:prolyl oligopeptidase family serine peptidase, partial [Escherichia coli]|nr:prolyl oligopeptidase family serine peptidase [Escherichia coli]
INLVQHLIKKHKIDPERIYVTGQSGGCMLAIAMNIKYPDFFTASYLVAGKWDAEQVAPIAKNKLWFMASEDDEGAFPSFNTITER